MAYEIISQNNTTTTLSDGTNTITVPARVTLATSTSYTISEVNNNTATLEGSDGSVIRDVPCVVVLAGEGGGGGSDQHNLGYYATQAALEEAHPTAEAGDWAIVGATDTVWLWDEDESAWVDSDQKGQVVSVNSKTGTVVLDAIDVKAVPEYSIMPSASADNANQIVLYSGATNGTYTKGYFYQNKVSSTPSSATISQTAGNSLSDLAVDKTTFEQRMGTTTGNYVFTFDGTKWEYDSAEVNLTDYGISYTGTPVADDAITVAYYAQVFLYYWERIDVQPASDPLPSQTGNSGKFLTTDGTDASWGAISALQNTATGTGALTILGTATNNNYAVNIGTGSAVTGEQGIALGRNTSAGGRWSIAVGLGSSATGDSGVAIGDGATATGANTIQLGSGSSTGVGTFSVGFGSSKNYQLLSNNGTIPTDRLANAINKYSTMPTAASTNEGWIVQFTGTTDSTYTHGHLYECVSDGQNPATYSWTEVSMGGSSLPDQTGQSGKFLTTDGTDASWSDKPLVNKTTANNAIAIAPTVISVANGNYGVSIGNEALAKELGVSVGYSAGSLNSSVKFATCIGYASRVTAIGGYQFGRGTNSEAGTVYFALNTDGNNTNWTNYKLLDSDGTIPTDRFTTTPVADGTYVPTLTISSGVATRSWAAPSGGGVTATTATLALNGWSSNTQTVNVTGVTSSSVIILQAAPASQADYTTNNVYCSAQGNGTLTFTCVTTPLNAITVNVIIM